MGQRHCVRIGIRCPAEYHIRSAQLVGVATDSRHEESAFHEGPSKVVLVARHELRSKVVSNARRREHVIEICISVIEKRHCDKLFRALRCCRTKKISRSLRFGAGRGADRA